MTTTLTLYSGTYIIVVRLISAHFTTHSSPFILLWLQALSALIFYSPTSRRFSVVSTSIEHSLNIDESLSLKNINSSSLSNSHPIAALNSRESKFSIVQLCKCWIRRSLPFKGPNPRIYTLCNSPFGPIVKIDTAVLNPNLIYTIGWFSRSSTLNHSGSLKHCQNLCEIAPLFFHIALAWNSPRHSYTPL